MTKQQITDRNETIGRNAFKACVTTQHPDWTIKKFSKKRYDVYDVVFVSGATQDNFIIGEIKFRDGYNYNAYDDWILEQEKLKSMQELRTKVQKMYPNKNIWLHYINFYRDNLTTPRMWDITNIEPDFGLLDLPNNSNTSTAYNQNTPATLLHNNDTINF